MNKFDEHNGENTVNLHTRILNLAKLDLNITMADKPEEKFISYTRFKQDKSKESDGFVIVENVSELEDYEKKMLNTIVHEIFTKSDIELKGDKKISDDELEQLFFKDNAAIKFLMDAQSMILSTEFFVPLHPTKYAYTSKILKIIITSELTRHYSNRLHEGIQGGEGDRVDKSHPQDR